MNATLDTDPEEAPPPWRAPVIACVGAGQAGERSHGVQLGSAKALCGASAAIAWRPVPAAVIECRACLAAIGRQAGAA